MAPQLPLGVQLRDDASFASFHVGPNAELLNCLQQVAVGEQGAVIYMHGPSGSGKTHLLQAVCRQASEHGVRAGYLPLAEFAADEYAALDGMQNLSLLCLDDVQSISAVEDWALLLMRLCDAARQNTLTLLIAADAAPAALQAALPDLRTRLGWGVVFGLQPLADMDRLQALQLRARARGLELPREVGQFLLQRKARDLPALMAMLGQLDTASLAAQRRLTIPFVKTVLGL
jgi:DnaA family protein